MSVIAVTMVRDEADVIGFTLAHLFAEGVDHIIVADNLSVDDTPDIIRSFGCDVTVVVDDEVGYYQADKMTRLAAQAMDVGATWVLPFDADELWTATAGTVAEAMRASDADVLPASEHKHWPTSADTSNPNPFVRLCHREVAPHHLHKVAFRAHPAAKLHMGNHDVDHPGERRTGVLAMRHFPYRSLEQFARKVRNGRQAYEASRLHRGYGTHWRTMGAMSDDDLAEQWRAWVDQPDLIFDPAPYRGDR